MGQHSNYSFGMQLVAVTKYPEASCLTESIDRSQGQKGTGVNLSTKLTGRKVTDRYRNYFENAA